ncbi:MAG: DMT family transporter [Betaproteobacteria bacterium]|nr:DMT family transporter [Betaproteobacteria bacterium]
MSAQRPTAAPLGVLWMLLAGALFAAMGVFAKFGAQWFGAAELVFWRSVIGLTALGLLARLKRWPLATPHWRLHLLRGLSGVVSLGLYFWCIARLPLATAVTLNYTSPLFLALFSALLLHERLRADRMRALCLAFGGVVLLLEPTLREDQWRDALLGLASGVLAATAYLNVKRLGATGEPGWRVVFWFTVVSTAASGAWMALAGFTIPTVANLWTLLGVGATATVGQLAMTRAYLTGNTLVVGAFAYSTVVFSTLFGLTLWGERLAPVALAGMALIIAGGVLVLRDVAPPR